MRPIYNFTYNDYIKFIHNIKQDKYFKLDEELEEYIVFKVDNINQKYKKIMKDILTNKKKLENFINQYTFSKNSIIAEELVYIDYIEEIDKIRVIYKQVSKAIFYLIIYQKEINLNLPYDILNYCTKIIHKQREKISTKIVIVPIVIYMQEDKYNYKKTTNNFFELTTYDNHILELRYNLIKVNIQKHAVARKEGDI